VDPEAFRQKFEAYVRSQCPADHPDPGCFLYHHAKTPDDDRDGNFTAIDGVPIIRTYWPEHGLIPREPPIETCLVAHEFGHFRSWQRQNEEQRAYLAKIVHADHSPTTADEDAILAEEELAWELGRDELVSQGFEAWGVFDACRRRALGVYRQRFGRAS
jgi:hypothetical protein